MILIFFNYRENELCALNALKYIILIPQLTSKDLGKSSHQAFQKQHVVQEELSLIMHSLMCMCALTHTQYKWSTNPYYLLFYRCRLRDRLTTLATVWTPAFLQTIWQVLLISRMLQFQSSLSVSLALVLDKSSGCCPQCFFRTFISKICNKVVFGKLFMI